MNCETGEAAKVLIVLKSSAALFPVLPGKTAAVKQFSKTMLGERRKEYEESRRKLGVTVERAWMQQTPMGDFVVAYWEAEDPARLLQGMGASNSPFDVWFRQQVKELHGVDLSKPPPAPAPELFHDWSGH